MKKILLGLLVSLSLVGCTTIVTKKADFTKDPNGVRVIPLKQILQVNAKDNISSLILVQDKELAYDIKPISVFSKHEFEVSLNDAGALTVLKSNQDSTSILNLFQRAAELSKGEAASGNYEAVREIKGTFGLESGYYEWKNNRFEKIK
ncbi:hypothetical protein [Acinetobacter junii]|uniref:hypothetical protein n=1 Tax=Acinetobacter junii TaxID=40215 RepID=UPI0032152187